MSSTKTTQPQEKKAAPAKAKPSPARKKGPVARTPAAKDVVAKLEAGVKPAPPTQVPNPLAKADALLAKAQPTKVAPAKAKADEDEAAAFAKLPVEEQRKRAESYLPKSDKRVPVEFSRMQAEACLNALQCFTDYAPDYGNKRKNMVHDATVFTAYYVIEDALKALEASERVIEVVTADDIPPPEPEPVKEPVAAG